MISLFRHAFDPLSDEVERRLGPLVQACIIEQLLTGYRIQHTHGEGGARTFLHARHGLREWCNESPSLVVNRVKHVTGGLLGLAPSADSVYAEAEANALFWSIIEGFSCEVYNAPRALKGFQGPVPAFQWIGPARRHGIATRDFLLATEQARHRSATRAATEFDLLLPCATLGQGPGWFGRKGVEPWHKVWLLGPSVLGTVPDVSTKALLHLAAELGVNIGTFIFSTKPDGGYCLHEIDNHPMQLPEDALELLCKQLVAVATQEESASAT